MPLAPTSALYYPDIDITDVSWLKSAALFWENIRTIVPEGFARPYSDPFAQELHDEGILLPLSVAYEMSEIEELSDNVLDYLTDPASIGVLFGNPESRPTLLHPKKLPRQIRELAEVHPMKLPYIIREQLQDCLSDRGFMQVDSGFAAFYMTLLARQLSGRLGLGLVTGSSEADQFASSIRKGNAVRHVDIAERKRPGRYYEASGASSSLPRETAIGMMFDLMIEGVSIPADISAKALIKFRQEHTAELAVLRREVSRLVSELPEEPSLEALRQGVHDQYTNQVLPALRSLRSSLAAQGWESALNGFLKISFFSVASTSAPALLHVPTPLALMAGTGVSVAATLFTCVTQRGRTLQASPFSYLLACNRAW